ncbi:hypothetical protein KQI86_13035 [Clostridium sp. MSJ-11]|uniref:DUF2283 domain-containing protein n=1 Tax=Clostridium mobile TaxID=2841512 RepID=A0ABS6EKR3_9CLOT|nr:hypothetical protein [Clostridium mobile]MBU5485261.1 hypothetical protein [Clostridium mobile]
MKYYFYDNQGNVYLIYGVEPPIELGAQYIKTDEIFAEKEGYRLEFKVIDGILYSEYIELPKDKYELLLAENEATKQALAELTLFISTMNGGI